MELILQNHSSYPYGDQPSPQPPRRMHAARASDATAVVERAHIDEILHEQAQAGVDVVTDGHVDWSDPLSHVREAFALARLASPLPVKPVLPGPYTLARLAENGSDSPDDVPARAHALSKGLAAAVKDLVDAGATIIQIEEPAILSHPEDIRLLRQLLEPIWQARGDAQMVLATYFGDAEPLYAQLNSLPADILALDCTGSAGLADEIAATGASKVLALGVVDGRDPRLEDPGVIARHIETMLKRYVLDTVHLMPSCGLEQLPRARARAKLELLATVRRLVGALT
jgi:5-methyltetrahydropteroyltriglutamate--homocysteine methyltransferase